jgi:hypothetical protein
VKEAGLDLHHSLLQLSLFWQELFGKPKKAFAIFPSMRYDLIFLRIGILGSESGSERAFQLWTLMRLFRAPKTGRLY